MQTRVGFISGRRPLDRLFSLEASCTSQSNTLSRFTRDQVSGSCDVIIAACSSRSLARVCASWSHTRRSPGTLWYAFTDCTAALCCLPPPPPPPPPTPPPSESLIRLQCSATCCVYSLAAPPALILVCAPRSCFHFYTSLEDPPCAR